MTGGSGTVKYFAADSGEYLWCFEMQPAANGAQMAVRKGNVNVAARQPGPPHYSGSQGDQIISPISDVYLYLIDIG